MDTCLLTDAERKELIERLRILHDQQMRPSTLYKPRIYPDGDMWCALYGVNLQEGVAGFGESPALAMEDFDANWCEKMEKKEKKKCPKCHDDPHFVNGSSGMPCRRCGGFCGANSRNIEEIKKGEKK